MHQIQLGWLLAGKAVKITRIAIASLVSNLNCLVDRRTTILQPFHCLLDSDHVDRFFREDAFKNCLVHFRAIRRRFQGVVCDHISTLRSVNGNDHRDTTLTHDSQDRIAEVR